MLRAPKCSRCRNHGFLVLVKGHAGKCPWKKCLCEKCCLITERQKIIAKEKMLRDQEAEDGQETGPAPAPGAQGLPPAATPGPSLHSPPPPPRPDPETSRLPEQPPGALSAGPTVFWSVVGNRGHSHLGLPRYAVPQFRPEAAVRPHPGPEPPIRPTPSTLFVDSVDHSLRINPDSVVGAEYLETEPSNMCLGYSTMYSYQRFPLDSQDMSPAVQKGFLYVPCSSYQGRIVAPEPVRNFYPEYYGPPPLPPQPLPPPPLPPPPPPPLPPPPPPQQHQQPLLLPPGLLSGLHLLPPPPPPPPPLPPTFSLNFPSENTGNQYAVVPSEPYPTSSQEQSD